MRAKIFRVLFCIFILTGTFLGSIIKEKETSETRMIITASGVRYETKDAPETEKAEVEENGEAEVEEPAAEPILKAENAGAEDTMAEEPDEGMDSLGLPLMEDTALLVTEEKRLSNNYEFISAEYEYDSEGRLLRYLGDSIIDYNDREYEYDADGRCIKESHYKVSVREKTSESKLLKSWVEYSYGTDESGQTIRTQREYDKNGNIQEERVYDSEETLLKRTSYSSKKAGQLSWAYEYDPKGGWEQSIDYDDEGRVERRYLTEYDDHGSVIFSGIYDGEGNETDDGDCDCGPDIFSLYGRRYEYQFDEAGNLIMQTAFDENGKQTGHMENSYDERGNLIREALYDAENTLREYEEYSYDEKGNLEWEYSYYDDYEERGVKTGYEYDAAGRCIREGSRYYYDYKGEEGETLTEDPLYTIWEREYDDRGRLITYTDYSDKEWYNYSYKMICGSDEDYPYDRIRINVY